MIYDFNLVNVLKLHAVKRCGIIEMSNEQSVAEHSYNVAMICMEILNDIDPQDLECEMRQNILEWALVHDLTELVTGDIPTPFKKAMDGSIEDYELKVFPKLTVHKKSLSKTELAIAKVADLLEAYVWISKYCIDTKKEEILSEIVANMVKVCDGIPDKFKHAVERVCYATVMEYSNAQRE